MSGVYVRAKTADGRWASVDAADLDDRSFREFVLRVLAECGLVVSVIGNPPNELKTPLTKAQAEGEEE